MEETQAKKQDLSKLDDHPIFGLYQTEISEIQKLTGYSTPDIAAFLLPYQGKISLRTRLLQEPAASLLALLKEGVDEPVDAEGKPIPIETLDKTYRMILRYSHRVRNYLEGARENLRSKIDNGLTDDEGNEVPLSAIDDIEMIRHEAVRAINLFLEFAPYDEYLNAYDGTSLGLVETQQA